MHRRARHFNPRSAGATFVLDARYIDASNNSSLSQWNDISGSGNNVTQGTLARQPVYKSAQQGGQPVVSFSTGGMSAAAGLGGSTAAFIVFVTLKSFNYNGTAGGGMTISQGASNAFTSDFLIGRTSTLHFLEFDNGANGGGTVAAPSTGPQIQTALYDGTQSSNSTRLRYFFNGTEQTLTYDYTVPSTLNPGGTYSIGQYACIVNDTAWYLNGDMCSVSLIKSSISTSLRKKIEQCAALSFKIPCS